MNKSEHPVCSVHKIRFGHGFDCFSTVLRRQKWRQSRGQYGLCQPPTGHLLGSVDSVFLSWIVSAESRDRSQSVPRRTGGKVALGLLAGLVGSCGAILYFLDQSVEALENRITLPSYPWSFNGVFKTFDHAALRRGWQVYQTLCHTCHSLKYVRFLDLIDVTHTREEVKALVEEYEVREPIISDFR